MLDTPASQGLAIGLDYSADQMTSFLSKDLTGRGANK